MHTSSGKDACTSRKCNWLPTTKKCELILLCHENLGIKTKHEEKGQCNCINQIK